MSNLNELRKEIAELEAKAAQPYNEQPKSTQYVSPDAAEISDDDLAQYLHDPEEELVKLCPGLFATTLPEAKHRLAENREERALLGTVRNEQLPMVERITAAIVWRSRRGAGNTWERLTDTDLVESLCVHPHLDRLNELYAYVSNPNVPKGDWRAYLHNQWAAMEEFHNLRTQFPLRDVPAMVSLEAAASRIIKNSPSEVKDDFTARREIYDYARDLSGK